MTSKQKAQIDELARLIAEFKLTEAEIESAGFRVSLRKASPPVVQMSAAVAAAPAESMAEAELEEAAPAAPVVTAPVGVPVTSPMTGIYYSSSSPGNPPFVTEGDSVTAGQVVGLIEAMKVFNEIHATTSGIVKKIAVETGQIVNPGDPLIYIA